jgi:hypothetical protein
MTDTLDTQIRALVTELINSAPQAPSLSELERRENQVAGVPLLPRAQGRLSLRRPVILAALGAVVALGATSAGLTVAGSFGAHKGNTTTRTGSGSHPEQTAFNRHKVVSAVLTADQDEILSETTEFVDPGGQIVNAKRVFVDNTGGNAVYETLSASGSPADALVFSSESVIDIYYAKQVWWPVQGRSGARSPSLQDPESTISGVQSLVSSGQLKVVSRAEINGQAATEVVGEADGLPGSSLTLWVSQATNLPIQAIGTQSDGSQQVTSYLWLARNDQNVALAAPAVPSGFMELSGPPAGEVPTSPLG